MGGVEEDIVAFNVLAWIPRIIFLIIVLTTILIFLNYYSKIEIHSFEPESEFFVYRILNSTNGISYYDSVSGRVYPGTIDITKFENETINILQNSVNYGADKHLGAKILIKDLDEIPLVKAFYNPKT